MGYEMELTDKQWFNLICGMNAGLMGLEKDAPHSSAKTEDKQVNSVGELVIPLPSGYSFRAVPLTYENDGFNQEGTGSLYSYFHITSATLDSLEVFPEPPEETRDHVIEWLTQRGTARALTYIGKIMGIYEIVSQHEEIDVFINGRGSIEYSKVIEIDDPVYGSLYSARYTITLSGWLEAHQSHKNLCVAGGGNYRPLYFEWKIYLGPTEGENSIVGKHVTLSFAQGDYDGGRVYATSWLFDSHSEISELPDGATADIPIFTGQYPPVGSSWGGKCGAYIDIPVFPAPSAEREAGYVGKLMFGPIGNRMSGIYAYEEERSIAAIIELIVNGEVIVDRRSSVYWANDLRGNPEIVYYLGNKSRWGFVIFGQVYEGVTPEPSTQTSINSDTKVTSTEASARPSGAAEINRLLDKGLIYEKNGRLVYVMTDGDPRNRNTQEINSLINKFGYVGYSCVMNCTEAQTLYFYVADKATGEALTPAVPVSAQVGRNEITVKIPLVSENGLCDEYDIKYFIERTYDSSFSSLEEAEEANAVSNNGTTTIDAGATVISQSTQGSPPLPIMPYGEDKITVEDEISVTVRTVQGDVDLSVDDTVTVEDDVDFTSRELIMETADVEETVTVEDDVDFRSHTPFNGEADIKEKVTVNDDIEFTSRELIMETADVEETVTVEDDIDFRSHTPFNGEADIKETVTVEDDIEFSSRELIIEAVEANETSSISDDISSTST